jgi:exopolysaccharide biosynthesis polyprenyl glycosylphosphotransferase
MLEPSTSTLKSQAQTKIAANVELVVSRLPASLQWRLLKAALVVHDFSVIGLAFLFAYTIRFQLEFVVFQNNAFSNLGYYQVLSLALIPIWLLIFATQGLYRKVNLLGGTTEYSLIFRSTSLGIFVLIVISFLAPDFVLARGWLFAAWGIAFLALSLGRFLIRRVAYMLRRRGYLLTPALIIGANKEGQALAEQLIAWQTSGLHVVGFVDNLLKPGSRVFAHLHNLGSIDYLDSLIKKHTVGELILSNSALSQPEILKVFKKYGLMKHLNLHLSSGLFEIITTGMDVSEFAYVPLVRVRRLRLNGVDRLSKLLLDYAILIPGLMLIMPLLLLIAIAIKLDSRGPVIYRRRVMGLNGKQFDAFKFRTMFTNGRQILNQQPELQNKLQQEFKLKDDPRITNIGRWLRRTSLDELPQLFNVLTREMSLVGPRIISPPEMEKYGDWDLNLLTVPPGITGLWQVSGRSDLSYDERVRLDMYYIRNWTIWSDMQILWQTIPAVIKGRGAY